MSQRKWRVVGLCFDHPHQEDQLTVALAHPNVDVVGVFDTDITRMQAACERLKIGPELQFSNYQECFERTRPDIAILCPTTATHADWTERVASFDVHVIMEKPFALSLPDADRMITAVETQGRRLAINWPMEWYPTNRTTKRLISEGRIGKIRELHYYDGNRHPELLEALELGTSPTRWWYQREHGGGAMQDYLGYGTTLATWFLNGDTPLRMSAVSYTPPDADVDLHGVAVASYSWGLATFQARWGMFCNPWDSQTQPYCGFVVGGTEGTITSADFSDKVLLQTADDPRIVEVPVDKASPIETDSVAYIIHCLETDAPFEGPSSPTTSRIGQVMVDAAMHSVSVGRSVAVEAGRGSNPP